MTPRRTIQWSRVLWALAILVAVEMLWAPGHDWLDSTLTAVTAKWSTSSVQLWPMTAWKALLDAVGLTTTQTRGVTSVLALLVGFPLLIIGSLVLQAIWVVPYVVLAVLFGFLAAAVKLHLLPLIGVAALAGRLVPEWRQYFFPVAMGIVRGVPPTQIGTPVAAPATAPAAGGARFYTMGPEVAHLADRRDAMTSSRFEPGERFILCGGACGRPYKLVTCEFFEYRCPKDGSSLRPVGA